MSGIELVLAIFAGAALLEDDAGHLFGMYGQGSDNLMTLHNLTAPNCPTALEFGFHDHEI